MLSTCVKLQSNEENPLYRVLIRTLATSLSTKQIFDADNYRGIPS